LVQQSRCSSAMLHFSGIGLEKGLKALYWQEDSSCHHRKRRGGERVRGKERETKWRENLSELSRERYSHCRSTRQAMDLRFTSLNISSISSFSDLVPIAAGAEVVRVNMDPPPPVPSSLWSTPFPFPSTFDGLMLVLTIVAACASLLPIAAYQDFAVNKSGARILSYNQ